MSVKTSTFGGVRLSGEEADKFVKQVTYGRPKQAAQDAAARGNKMVSEYTATGHVTIRARKR